MVWYPRFSWDWIKSLRWTRYSFYGSLPVRYRISRSKNSDVPPGPSVLRPWTGRWDEDTECGDELELRHGRRMDFDWDHDHSYTLPSPLQVFSRSSMSWDTIDKGYLYLLTFGSLCPFLFLHPVSPRQWTFSRRFTCREKVVHTVRMRTLEPRTGCTVWDVVYLRCRFYINKEVREHRNIFTPLKFTVESYVMFSYWMYGS